MVLDTGDTVVNKTNSCVTENECKYAIRFFIDLLEKVMQAPDADLSKASSLYREEDLDSCQSEIDQKHCATFLV